MKIISKKYLQGLKKLANRWLPEAAGRDEQIFYTVMRFLIWI